jgi:hypothetical protein
MLGDAQTTSAEVRSGEVGPGGTGETDVVRLITQRSRVQIPPPLPSKCSCRGLIAEMAVRPFDHPLAACWRDGT